MGILISSFISWRGVEFGKDGSLFYSKSWLKGMYSAAGTLISSFIRRGYAGWCVRALGRVVFASVDWDLQCQFGVEMQTHADGPHVHMYHFRQETLAARRILLVVDCENTQTCTALRLLLVKKYYLPQTFAQRRPSHCSIDFGRCAIKSQCVYQTRTDFLRTEGA